MVKHRSHAAVKHSSGAKSPTPRMPRKSTSVHPKKQAAEKNAAEVFPLFPFDNIEGEEKNLLAWPLQTFKLMMSPLAAWMSKVQAAEKDLFPKIESLETESAHIYHVQLPEVTHDQVSLKIENGMIMLHVNATQEQKEKGYYSSRSLRRALSLPIYTNGKGISAKLKEGKLTITIPKTDNPVAPSKNTIHIT